MEALLNGDIVVRTVFGTAVGVLPADTIYRSWQLFRWTSPYWFMLRTPQPFKHQEYLEKLID